MKTYIVHISDAGSFDGETPVKVHEDTSLAAVAHLGLAKIVSQHASELQLPLFLDIHAAEQFEPVSWMHHQSAG